MTFAFPSTNDLVDRRTLASLLIVVRNSIRSSLRMPSAEDTWKALVHFCICGSTSCQQDLTFNSSALGITGSAGGAGTLLSTLSGLNGNSPLAVKSALIFFSVNATFLAGLYREVKCSLPIVFIPPYSSRSTWSRYAAFNGANGATS